MAASSLIHITNEHLQVLVDAADGARITSLRYGGEEFLRGASAADASAADASAADASAAHGGLDYGSYPMAPFAGRIALGHLNFRESEYHIFRRLEPHAIHGTVLDRTWQYTGQDNGVHTFSIDGDERWPFPFTLMQRISLNETALTLELHMTSEVEQPAWLGWHPWWNRNLAHGRALELTVPARTMLERIDMIPTGAKISPTQGPWDDTFTDLDGPVLLTWPGFAQVAMTSSHPWWVVYTEPEDALCVEPQSAPPHAATLGMADIVGPGASLTISTTWTFTSLDPSN